MKDANIAPAVHILQLADWVIESCSAVASVLITALNVM
jgi:hypothetical protein